MSLFFSVGCSLYPKGVPGDTQKVNGQRICEVKVYYRYVGNVDGALAQERGQDYGEAI